MGQKHGVESFWGAFLRAIRRRLFLVTAHPLGLVTMAICTSLVTWDLLMKVRRSHASPFAGVLKVSVA